MRLKCNSCDGLYSSIDVRFTKKCANSCPYCIEKDGLPALKEISGGALGDYIVRENIQDVLILGGEPFLDLPRLNNLVRRLFLFDRKVTITTSLPLVDINNLMLISTMSMTNHLNISMNHYDFEKNMRIQHNSLIYDQESLLKAFLKKWPDKIRINLNVMKGGIDNQSELIKALKTFSSMGVRYLKINELQYADLYVSILDMTKDSGLKNSIHKHPYSQGCQYPWGFWETMKIFIKQSCFLVEKSQKASVGDLLKVTLKAFNKPKNKFRVVYEDGSVRGGWAHVNPVCEVSTQEAE